MSLYFSLFLSQSHRFTFGTLWCNLVHHMIRTGSTACLLSVPRVCLSTKANDSLSLAFLTYKLLITAQPCALHAYNFTARSTNQLFLDDSPPHLLKDRLVTGLLQSVSLECITFYYRTFTFKIRLKTRVFK